jgi:oligopeptide/dipeptide ABC transporter ATP-binding protein
MHSTPGSTEAHAAPLLEVAGLRVAFDTADGVVHAVRGVSLTVGVAECLAIVGESGSGKSQLVLACLGLLADNGRAAGSARFRGRELVAAGERGLRETRGAGIGFVSQDPMNALTPHLRIGDQLVELVTDRRLMSRRDAQARALDLLQAVGIDDPRTRLGQYPHELSGGQRQRVAVAMALMPGPALLIADEPTTALDVTVQSQLLGVLRDLRAGGLSVVLVTHDLGVVAGIADRVAVMYAGSLVEVAPAAALFDSPRHPYSEALLASVPRLEDAPGERLPCIPGQPPRPHEPLSGCPFAPRCPWARDSCRMIEPPLEWHGECAWACPAPRPRGWPS